MNLRALTIDQADTDALDSSLKKCQYCSKDAVGLILTVKKKVGYTLLAREIHLCKTHMDALEKFLSTSEDEPELIEHHSKIRLRG